MTTAMSSQLTATNGVPLHVPKWILTLLAVTIVTSFFVQIEPAPTDLMFVITVGMMMVTGRVAIPNLGKMCWLGVFLYVIADLISMTQVRHQLPDTLKFWAITQYMFISFVVYAGMLAWDSSRVMSTILKTYYLATVIASGLGMLALFKLVPFASKLFRDDQEVRICSTFKDPNVMAPFVIPGCMIAIWSLTQTKKNRVLHLIGFSVTTAAVLLAYSRASWGNLLLAIGIYFSVLLVSSPNVKRNMNLIVSAGVGLTVLFVVLLVLGSYLGHLDYLTSRLSLQGYDSTRFGNIAKAIKLSASNPFGIGPGQARFRLFQQVHCVYVGVLCEAGLVGFIGFALVLMATIHRALVKAMTPSPNRNMDIMILSVLLGSLLNCIVVNSIHWRHFFLILALPWASPTSLIEPFTTSRSLFPFRKTI